MIYRCKECGRLFLWRLEAEKHTVENGLAHLIQEFDVIE